MDGARVETLGFQPEVHGVIEEHLIQWEGGLIRNYTIIHLRVACCHLMNLMVMKNMARFLLTSFLMRSHIMRALNILTTTEIICKG